MIATNEQLRADLASAVAVDASGLDFMVFTDLRKSVEADVNTLNRSPYLAGVVPTSGFVWDLQAEQLQPVVVDPRSRFATTAGGTDGRRRSQPPGRTQQAIPVPTGGIGPRANVPGAIQVPTGGLGRKTP